MVGAVVVLLVSALAVQSFGVSLWPAGDDSESSANEAYGLDDSPIVGTLDVPDASVPADQVIDVVSSTVDETLQTATDNVGTAIAEADANLEAAASLHAGLPEVPLEYLPGMDVSTYVDAVSVAGHVLPPLDSTVSGTVDVAASWASMPANIPGTQQLVPVEAEQVLEETSLLDELDALVGEIEAAAGQELLPSELDDLTGGLGSGLPVNPLDALSDADPQSTAQPHEEGAEAAFEHADALIGAADSVFSDVQADADAALDQSLALVSAVESTVSSLETQGGSIASQIATDAQDRIDATLSDAATVQTNLEATVDNYVAGLEAQLVDANADVEDVVDAQVAWVLQTTEEQQAALDATISDVQADAAFRIDAIQSSTKGLLSLKDAAGASPDELQDILDDSVAALDLVRAESSLQLAALNDAKASLQADADATVAEVQAMAQSHLDASNALVAQSISETTFRLAFATALADATVDATVEAHLATAEAHIDGVHALVDTAQVRLIQAALDLSQRSVTALDDVEETLEAVQSEAYEEVGHDLDYIQKVAEDYSTVPIPDREERAAYWSAVHGQVMGGLGGALSAGDEALGSVSQAQAAATANVAALSAMV